MGRQIKGPALFRLSCKCNLLAANVACAAARQWFSRDMRIALVVTHVSDPALRSHRAGFTLTELLVVISIIAVLATLTLSVSASVRQAGNRTRTLSNFRQLATGVMAYAQDNDNALPAEGDANPTWASAASAANRTAWYNVIPRALQQPGLADFATKKAPAFYNQNNLLYVPGAPVPADVSRPYFTVSICSKFRQNGIAESTVRLNAVQAPATTVLFQESGITGEKTLPGQKSSNYDGQSKSYATRTIARLKATVLVVFCDGHVREMAGKDMVNPSGKAWFPQIGPAGGKVYWTLDPEVDAND